MGRSAVSTITVTPRPVASLVITPPQASVLVARTTQLSAQPLDATGTLLTGRTITWSSSDVTVARVDAAGLVTGVAPGAATIVATSEGRSAQSAVTVALPPVRNWRTAIHRRRSECGRHRAHGPYHCVEFQ
jgi:trimeric autotransporter adhesin